MDWLEQIYLVKFSVANWNKKLNKNAAFIGWLAKQIRPTPLKLRSEVSSNTIETFNSTLFITKATYVSYLLAIWAQNHPIGSTHPHGPFTFIWVIATWQNLILSVIVVQGSKSREELRRDGDDTLIFCWCILLFCRNSRDFLNIKCIVLCFQAVSCLKINLAKSEWSKGS